MAVPLSVSELGNLWQAYQEKSLMLRLLEHFLEKTTEGKVQTFLQKTYNTELENEQAIRTIFNNEGAVIPAAFSKEEVNKDAPQLFDDDFVVMHMRMSNKVLTGLYALHAVMSYREDIRMLYKDFTMDSENIYSEATQYLLEEGVLARPPIIPMPNEVVFVKDKSYMSGFPLLEKKRVLNAVELGLIYQTLETNITGMQLLTGFAQVAKEEDVKKYFIRGKELAKKAIEAMSAFLLESDIPAPSTWSGSITRSTISPFSDRLMIYNTNLLSMFGLGSSTVGGAGFSFRSDLLLKFGQMMVDTFDFAKDGGKIMIKHGWLEEPPQAVDRSRL